MVAMEMDGSGVVAPGRDAAYAAALRHSRRVRFLRRVIPVLCVAMLASPILFALVAPFTATGPDIQLGKTTVSGSKITMDTPKLSGFKRDNRGYDLTAQTATQDLKQPSVVDLVQLDGRMEQSANSYARLKANWGRFDQSANRLDLKGNVRVRTDQGYEVDLDSAQVDMKSGNMTSAEPVAVRTATGTVNANGVEVRENGKHIIFTGGVRSTFIHNEAEPEPAKEGTAP